MNKIKSAILALAVVLAVSTVSDSHAFYSSIRKAIKWFFESSPSRSDVDDMFRRIKIEEIDKPPPSPKDTVQDDGGVLPRIVGNISRAAAHALARRLRNSASENSEKCPLCNAARRGNLAEIYLLLAEDANPNSVNSNGMTALIVATIEGHAEIVRVLLVAGTNVNHAGKEGITALMAASLFGYSEVVKVLLGGELNVNAVSRNGYTALQLANTEGHSEIVRILRAAGAE